MFLSLFLSLLQYGEHAITHFICTVFSSGWTLKALVPTALCAAVNGSSKDDFMSTLSSSISKPQGIHSYVPCAHCPVVCMCPLWPPLSQMLAGPWHVPRNLLVGVMHFLTNLNLEGKIRPYETIHVTETTARLFYQGTDQGCQQLGTPSSFHFFVGFQFFYYVRSVLLCIAVFG